jgi:hypothetical protein
MISMPAAAQQKKRPNIVMLMTDDTGRNDFGAIAVAAPDSAIQHQTSIEWPRKAQCAQERHAYHRRIKPVGKVILKPNLISWKKISNALSGE